MQRRRERERGGGWERGRIAGESVEEREGDRKRDVGGGGGGGRQGERGGDTGGERGRRDRERENSNSKTLFYKDCSLGSVKTLSNN